MGTKWKKWLALPILALAIIGGVYTHSAVDSHAIVAEAASTEVTISNAALKNRLLFLLGKSSSDKLYVDDFVNHEDYQAVTTEDPITHIESTSANIRYLDLDGINLHNIDELAKFEWPTTLAGISLARNNITNDDIAGLINFASYTTTSDVTVDGKTFHPVSNISETLKKINLNFNNIITNNLDVTTRDNTLLLFGIQNAITSSPILTDTEASAVQHYIRELDVNYMSYNISFKNYITGIETSGYSSVGSDKLSKNVIDNATYGTYKINVSSHTKSETSYFYGYNDTLGDENCSFKHVSVAFDPDFYVERKQILVIPYKLEDLNNWASTDNSIIIRGFDEITSFSYLNASTESITTPQFKNYCVVIITGDGITRQFSVEFIVKDTIKPVIELQGKSTVYTSQHKNFIDPGYRAYDPVIADATDGDNLADRVRMYDDDTGIEIASLNTSNLGTKKIRYVVTDLAGNVSTPVVRTVIILEKVLDRVNIRINDESVSLNKTITLFAEPGDGVPLDKYTDYKYEWYLDGVLFRTTTPIDNISKKTSTDWIPDSIGSHKITVKLIAKQISDNAEIEVESVKEIEVVANFTDNESLLIAVALAILAIIIIIAIITYLKFRNRKKSTHHKSSKKAKKKAKEHEANSEGGITVIKDYPVNPNGTTGSTVGNGGTSGGGNENNRLPETGDTHERE